MSLILREKKVVCLLVSSLNLNSKYRNSFEKVNKTYFYIQKVNDIILLIEFE